jgi:hypothetical protein
MLHVKITISEFLGSFLASGIEQRTIAEQCGVILQDIPRVPFLVCGWVGAVQRTIYRYTEIKGYQKLGLIVPTVALHSFSFLHVHYALQGGRISPKIAITGLSTSILVNLAAYAVRASVFDVLRPSPSRVGRFIRALCAISVSVFAVLPFQTVLRVQLYNESRGLPSGFFHCAEFLLRNGGIMRFYAGAVGYAMFSFVHSVIDVIVIN